jgi:hypothetical protein
MPVVTDQPAPYAPASAVLDLIERHRNKGLPALIDADVLIRAGVSDSLVPRTLQALKALDLVTEDGRPSDTFEGIRLAPTAEYHQTLKEWLTSAYADALSYVDPASDDEVAIRDAFRKYVPTGQQGRMVSLFMGLFTAAGVMPARQKQAAPKKSGGGNAIAKPPRARVSETSRSNRAVPAREFQARPKVGELPPAIAGLVATLPADGGSWTQSRRDQFMATLQAVLDYTFKIEEHPTPAIETATDQ